MGHYASEMGYGEETKEQKKRRKDREEALEKLIKATKMSEEELKDALKELGFKNY